MTRPLAYSYIRMSTELQLKGDSLRRQRELSEQYARENGLELVQDFELHDIGVSAYKGANVSRGALGRFLEAIKAGEVPRGSYLLVESLDRLTRQTIDNSVSLFLEITRSGVNLVTLADNHLYRAGDTDFAQLIYSIVVMARANEESAIKSSRISAAWKNKRSNLENRVLTRTCPAWLEVKGDRSGFNVNESRAAIVRQIFEAAASGQGSGVITRLLNSDNVPVFGRSNGWLESYTTKILKNRAVLGEIQPHNRVSGRRTPVGHLIENYFPKIIDEELFLKVQLGRRQRTVAGGGRRGPKQRNLFTHIAKCGYCGASMRYVNKGQGPKGGRYLRCSASVRGMDCVAASWRYDDFEKSVFKFVREFDLKSIVEDNRSLTEEAKVRELQSITEVRLENKNTEQRRTYDMLLSQGDASSSFLKAQLERISEEIHEIEKELEEIGEKREQLVGAASVEVDTEEQLQALKELGEAADFKSRLLVANKLRELVKNIAMRTDGLKPKYSEVKELIEEKEKDAEFQSRLLEHMKSEYYTGPRSNPYFIITFHNGSSRTVIPATNDPTELIWRVDVDEVGYEIYDAGDLVWSKLLLSGDYLIDAKS